MMKKISKAFCNRNTVFFSMLAIALLLQTQGYCDNYTDIDATTSKVRDLLFSTSIKKAAITLGFGAGLFRAFMTGSIKPLLIYGGLGLAVCYLPALADSIGGLTTTTSAVQTPK